MKLAKGVRGDAPTLKPTFMVFAPAVLDRVRQAVQAKFSAASPTLKRLINAGLVAGEREFHAGRCGSTFFYNALIFKKVQKLIGGRVRLMISGSAPLSRETQIFMQTCFRCPLRQGYGLTETGSAGTISSFDDTDEGVGQVLTSVRVTLKDWEEGGYRTADANDPAIGMPRGEVLIGGPVVCQGYYTAGHMADPELEKKNATEFSVIDGVRFFHTGDIGAFTDRGQLLIIDRKKDLVKLQQGEYVALSKVENVLKQCPLVASTMVYAKSTESYCVALVVVNPGPIKKFAESLGMGGKSVKQLCAELRHRGGGAEGVREARQGEAGGVRDSQEGDPRRRTLDAGERHGHRRLQAQARQHLQGVQGRHRRTVQEVKRHETRGREAKGSDRARRSFQHARVALLSSHRSFSSTEWTLFHAPRHAIRTARVFSVSARFFASARTRSVPAASSGTPTASAMRLAAADPHAAASTVDSPPTRTLKASAEGVPAPSRPPRPPGTLSPRATTTSPRIWRPGPPRRAHLVERTPSSRQRRPIDRTAPRAPPIPPSTPPRVR